MRETLNLDALPPEVLADLRRAAAENGTSVAAEATARLVKVIRVDHPPPLGEPIPSLEISAPFDIPDPGPGRPVKVVRHDGPDRLEFWYGEDRVGE